MARLPDVALHRPATVEDASALLDDEVLAYAGGTELVPALRLGLRFPTALVDLKRVDGLGSISLDGDTLVVGALATHRRVSEDPTVREVVPSLAHVAAAVGNVRVRSTGTIGGNLCFAEPRSDLACLLVALGATVDVVGPAGPRSLAVEELIVGAFETSLEPGEVLTAVRVPREAVPVRYWKLQSAERPALGVAIVPGDGAATVVVGAATERPARADLPLGDAGAVRSFADGLELVDDLAGSAEYKRAVLVSHLLDELA